MKRLMLAALMLCVCGAALAQRASSDLAQRAESGYVRLERLVQQGVARGGKMPLPAGVDALVIIGRAP